ncbi:hypothetical protein [Vulcanisaeta distributa]|uniref:Uncharacterized protein n=1 Tax=Vulcanisaeta distributa (strain DSM 14429 / JCM 11212 / NBRC 100878 / IC-017) TaxID=572478 RepID=E1QSN4_VULDI|nr:hypothetical protein [Vulcanisaeta distributa]ADN49551.1 hypothetical protein Vdis_0138 [Vulcanisaeta distributa DSM 14429]
MRLLRRDGLRSLEREIVELGRVKLRMARVKSIISDNRELARFVNSWSLRCAEPLRDYCRSVLSRLVNYFTPESINELLSEVLARGLSVEAVLILLSQCDLLQCGDYAVREYVETGRVDVNQLMGILQGEGVRISPEDLKAVINGDYRVNQARSNRLSWLPRFIRPHR